MTPSPQKGVRIVALPLSRRKILQGTRNPCTDCNASTMLVYYHFDLTSRGGGGDLSWRQKVIKGITNRVTDIWAGLGKAPAGSWKLWTYTLGERITDQIDFEESALRGVNPSLGPIVPQTSTNKQVSEDQSLRSLPKIPLLYPPSLYSACLGAKEDIVLHPTLMHLQTLLASRGPRHRRGFYLWMFVAPFTVPVSLIPIIPNLPFFFCVWRSWSHYRAYKSSQYLSSLLERQLIEPKPSSELDTLYTSVALTSGRSHFPQPTLPSGISEHRSTTRNAASDRKLDSVPSGTAGSCCTGVFLTREAVPPMLAMLRLPESTAVNVYRAMDQARSRLRKL